MSASSSTPSPSFQSVKNTHPKPRLSFAQIFNMSVGFLGIQFGFALQNGNASRILQVFGADVEHLSWFWLVAPLTGMIVQPIIGHYSDKTWNRLGRRRPYFLTGALIAALGLIFMPNAGMFTLILPALWVGAGMLMIMDASFNVAMEPFRALVADKLPDAQRTLGYSVQTGLIGVGAVIGSWLPYILAKWFGVKEIAEEGKIPDNVIYSFIFGAIVLVIAIIWTIASTKEYPPDLQKLYTGEVVEENNKKEGLSQIWIDFKAMPKTMRQLGLVQFFSWFGLFSMWVFTTPAITRSKYDMHIGASEYNELKSLTASITATNSEDESRLKTAYTYFENDLNHLKDGDDKIFIESNLAAFYLNNKILSEKDLSLKFYDELSKKNNNPDQQIALKELHDVNVKYADGNAKNDETISFKTFKYCVENLQGENANIQPKLSLMLSLKKVVNEYNEGANWVGILFGVYNGVSALFAFFLPFFAAKLGRKLTHAIALICGSLGLLSIFFISSPSLLIVSMVGVGIAWASILAMPYVILSSSIPASKMGIYMGIFNFFITIPQIVSSLAGGPIVKYFFYGHAIYSIVLAGVLMFCAAISVIYVYDPSDSKDAAILKHNEIL